jgi:hypothetical protein
MSKLGELIVALVILAPFVFVLAFAVNGGCS